MNISFFEDRPNLDELDFKYDFLKKFTNFDIDLLPNLLFHGLPSSGKTTKIYAFLATLFNKKVYDLKNVVFEDDRKVLNYKSSIYHIEINCDTLGSNEKMFVQTFLRCYVETRNIGLDIPKIVYIKNANMLSRQTQLTLRRIIECNYQTAKFIFEVSSLSNFAEPIISRCLIFRIPLPKIDEIKAALINYSARHKIDIKEETINHIINESTKIYTFYNLKKIFGFYRYYVFTNINFKFLYYDSFNDIYGYITNKKFLFTYIKKIRDIINELYINVVPMEELLNFLFFKLLEKYKDKYDFCENLIRITVDCDKLLKKGNKECLHLELYTTALIQLIQKGT